MTDLLSRVVFKIHLTVFYPRLYKTGVFDNILQVIWERIPEIRTPETDCFSSHIVTYIWDNNIKYIGSSRNSISRFADTDKHIAKPCFAFAMDSLLTQVA